MTKWQRTVVTLLSVIATLLAIHVTIQVDRPAEATHVGAGIDDPCPADVNDDANVGVLDFLQVLADWGPCPSPPKVVDVDAGETAIGICTTAVLWTDGTVQVACLSGATCDSAPEPDCAGWVTLPERNPPLQEDSPVAIDVRWGNSGSDVIVVRWWASGLVESMVITIDTCDPPTCSSWTPLPSLPAPSS